MSQVKIPKISKISEPWGVKNQYLIKTKEGEIFQSYSSIIAYSPYKNQYSNPHTYLDEKYWNYSKTTLKYLRNFLGVDSIDDIRKRIKSKEYILTNLNK